MFIRHEASTEITLTSSWEYDDIPEMTKQTKKIFRGRPNGIYSLYCLFVSDLDRAEWERCPTVPGVNDRASGYETHPLEITRLLVFRILHAHFKRMKLLF
jgi:hypothetical protein